MIREKQLKTNLKSYKDNLIQCRSAAVKTPYDIRLPAKSLSQLSQSKQQRHQQKFHESTLNKSSHNSTLSQRRLKLKDYIHLNSLEKRQRSDSQGRNQQHQNISLKKKQQQISISQQQYVSTLKQQIELKIAQHQAQLSQINSFLKEDFTVRDSKETFLFLFSIYNTVNDMQKLDKGIGQKIIEFEGNEATTPHYRAKKQSYFWRRQKQLDSPAKILKNALKITFDLTNFLQIAE